MLHKFDFSKLVFLLTLVFLIQMPVIFTFLMSGTYTLGVRRTPNQTDSDVTLSTSFDQGKITKKV